MSKILQFRRGSTTRHATFTGAAGEITVDTTLWRPVVHDGVTPGGHPVTGGGALTDGDYGDVAVSGSGSAMTVQSVGGVALGSAAFTASSDYATAAALAAKAPLASPALTGAPTAPTAAPGTNSTQIATTAYVEAAVAAGGGGSPGGASGLVQYNNTGALGGAANVEIASGNLALVAGTAAAPAASRVVVYGESVAGRVLPAFRGAAGAAMPLAAHLGMSRRMEWTAQNGSTSLGAYGGTATTAGTLSARSIAAGSFFAWCRRVGVVSATFAGSSGEILGNRLSYGLGDAAGAGGFTLVATFGIADAAPVANARMFVGFTPATIATTNVNPSTLVNIIGVGADAGEATLSIMHNDGAGTATKVGLGANFPADTQRTDVYELVLYAPPQATEVGYRVTRLNTGDSLSGTLSSNLPAGSTLLSPHVWRNNGATALAVELAFMGLSVETDR